MLNIIVGVSAAAMTNGGLQAGNLCKLARPALPVLACAEAPLGVAFASTAARAEELAALGQAGEDRFKQHFNRDPVRYAVVESPDPPKLGPAFQALNAAGFRRTLAWLPRDVFWRRLEVAAKQNAEAIAKVQKLGAAETDAAVTAALEDIRSVVTRFEADKREAAVVPHELAHGWYTEAFWPGFQMDGKGHYGGPGPDWLDEIAPILVESGDSAEQRRSQFREIYQRRGQGKGHFAAYPAKALIDLRHFLKRQHPTKDGQSATVVEGGTRSNGPTLTVGIASGQSGLDLAVYYFQGRMFADFLIDRTGDPTIFGSIGEAFGRGETFEQWLAANGKGKALAESVAELDAQWRAWLNARFGAPAADRAN